ncbi:acetyl/propionyl-CoA carboxylase subunit alpha, partial [Streptomyces cirratus]
MAHPDVVSGNLGHTGLVERDLPSLLPPDGTPPEVYAAGRAAGRLRPVYPHAAPERPAGAGGAGAWVDPFGAADGWRLGGTPAWTVHHFRLPGQEPVAVRARPYGSGTELALLVPAHNSGADRNQARGPGLSPGAPARGRIVARTAGTVTVELAGVTHRFAPRRLPGGDLARP